MREHLRDAAARHRAAGAPAGDAELLATAEFGHVQDVAARLGRELALRETRIAALVALGAMAFFVFPLHVVPESTKPLAAWIEKPSELITIERAALGLWLTAGVLAAAGGVFAWSRWPRAASVSLIMAAGALVGATGASAGLFWRWTVYTPDTPNLALADTLAFPIVAACVAAAWWALTSRRRLPCR